METAQVSEDVIKDAKAYANSKCKNKGIDLWFAHYWGFIEGALSQKPVEHNQLPEKETFNPIYGNGNQESKSNQSNEVRQETRL